MADYIPTNAASSAVSLDKKNLKSIAARSDRPGLIYLGLWLVSLCVTGTGVLLTLDTYWMWLAMFVHGILLSVPTYSMSHETAHGTAFRTRWLNETVLWVSSLIYMEEPLHRRYTHTSHHTFTWWDGKDAQFPFDTPMGLKGWLTEISGLGLLRFHLHVLWQLVTKQYTDMMRSCTPEPEFPKMTRNARAMMLIYACVAVAPFFGVWWPIWLIVVPRLLGTPVMLLFTLIQHVELQENSPSILESTRSFRTNWLGKFLYMNMNNHVEHHLYPNVPFHALPDLAKAVKDQVPAPDPGFFRSNWEVVVVAFRRSCGLSTKAPSIRQAPHMISEGGRFKKFAKRSM
jgi:fatty acid desaturase